MSVVCDRPAGKPRGPARTMARVGADVRLAVVLLSLAWIAGCGRGAAHAPLGGRLPANTAPVGELALPEARADRMGVPFRFRPAPGHVLVVYFGYTTCPDVCPTTLGDLHRALARLGGDSQRVDVAFVTVDPDRDTPDVLAPYLAGFVADGHPLRPASQSQLAEAERAFGATSSVTRNPDGEVEVSHSGTMYVVDDRGRIADEWPFGSTADLMANDLRILLGAARR